MSMVLWAGPAGVTVERARQLLGEQGHEVVRCAGPHEITEAVNADISVVVVEVGPQPDHGVEWIRQAAAAAPDHPLIVVTERPSWEAAAAATRARAVDVLATPADDSRVGSAVARAVSLRARRRELARLREGLVGPAFEDLIGDSPPMRRLYRVLTRVAPSRASVLITGDTGTGKELVARAVHRRSPRRDGPFVAINCAAVPESLLESELFGHVKGAFTDARTARKGLFQRANGGTLFLDEVGDMPLGLQAKLLRALQERTVRPVGGDEEVSFDVRVVGATHQDLDQLVEEGKFRRDLYYRLAVIHVEVPCLSERGADVRELARVGMQRAEPDLDPLPEISDAVARLLLEYPWPGNVRELFNAMEHALALQDGDEITLGDLPSRIRAWHSAGPAERAEEGGELVTLDEVERRHILRVLQASGGSRQRAATILGVDRKTLYRKLKQFSLAEGDEA